MIEYSPKYRQIGIFNLHFNRSDNSPFYKWEEMGIYLFGHGKKGGQFWGDGTFEVPNGDVTTIKNSKHVNIGYWLRQKDDSLFVSITEEKVGFVLVKEKLSENYLVYWANLSDVQANKTLDRLALFAKNLHILNNPK